MNMRFLGKSGIKVSEICLGTMNFGPNPMLGALDQQGADKIVGLAIESGINFFDTADIYTKGQSEVILGKALGAKRKDVVLATKMRNRMGPGPNDAGLSRHHILKACEASLQRLGTDYIDVYYLHRWDWERSLEESLSALNDLVRQGKIRYIGCSNFAAWQVMKALSISEKHNWERFVVFEANYSLLSRTVEYEIQPLCVDQGIGITAFSALAGGFLSGKYRRGQARPENSRWTAGNPKGPSEKKSRFDEERAYDIVEEMDTIAKEHNVTINQVALNYLLRKPAVSSILVGIRKPEQLADNVKTTEWAMTPEEVARLDDVSSMPPAYPYDFLSAKHGDDLPGH